MSRNQSLQMSLDKLNYLSSKERRDVIETLVRIYRNISKDPNNKKYRKINISNQTFMDQVWMFRGAQEFMMGTGWQLDGSSLIFNDNNDCLLNAMDILLRNRVIAPSTNEWVDETKYEGKSREQLRDEELKKKAVAEREKELQEYMKEKQYREKLNNEIKAQIKSDRENRRLMSSQAAIPLKKNANSKYSKG